MSLEKDMVDLYIQAEKNVLEGKTITLRGESMGQEDLDKIRQGREYWERRAASRSNGGKSHSLSSFS
jgi:hypothetical protein